ncbi:MAG: hypothetical protein E2O36_07865 [Proteobacteria bacterium]|nr:MAG: hypothetical protein E2O36_07865 [Pseudomonadota bacterium]
MAFREMSDVTRIHYATSEIAISPAIYESATQILSAYVVSKQANDKNLSEMMDKSVRLALELALKVDKILKTPEKQTF